MGVPVISTDAGGQAELIDDKVGGLVHYNENPTPEIFEQEIEQYVEKTLKVVEKLDELKKNCRKKIIEGFTLDLMSQKFEKIFEEVIKNEKNKKNESVIDATTYELACEAFNNLYFNYTNDYYERNLGIYLTAKKNNHQRLYRHVRTKLELFGAVNEGKNIIEFIRSIKRLLNENINALKLFGKAFVSTISLIYKVIKRIATKPFRK